MDSINGQVNKMYDIYQKIYIEKNIWKRNKSKTIFITWEFVSG